MRKLRSVRFIAAAALAGSAGVAVLAPAAIAGAGAPKPPVTVTCTSLLGGESQQLLSGCSGSSSKAHTTAFGVSVPTLGATNTAIIYWTNKDTTTETFTYTASGTTTGCGTYLDHAPSLLEVETATVTGGNSKLTDETAPPSNACVYLGSDGTAIINGSSETF